MATVTPELVNQLMGEGYISSWTAPPTRGPIAALAGPAPMPALMPGAPPALNAIPLGPVPGSGAPIPGYTAIGNMVNRGPFTSPTGPGFYAQRPNMLGLPPASTTPLSGGFSGRPGSPINGLGGMRIPPGASGGVGVIDDIAAQAVGATDDIAKASRWGAWGNVGRFAKGGGGVASILGSIGGNYVGDKVGGDAGSFIKGASTGAGIGAMAGSLVPVVGTGIGAAAGGVIGGALSLLGGGDDFDGDKAFKELTSGLDSTTRSQLRMVFNAYKNSKDADGKKLSEEDALNAVAQTMLEMQQEEEAAAAQAQRSIALQAITAQYFAPLAQQMNTMAQQRYQTMQNLLPSLPEGYRAVAEMQNMASLDNAMRSSNAYAAQSMLIPTADALKQQMDMRNQIASQIQNMANAQIIQGTGLGGGQNPLENLQP